MRTLTPKTLLTIPKMNFETAVMWVDEAGGRLYWVYEGDVLSIPVPPVK
jgi:hypothetical protein